MRPPLRVGTVYDFRNTPESGMEMPSLYAAIMDQVVRFSEKSMRKQESGAR
jgi:hypothetical protein